MPSDNKQIRMVEIGRKLHIERPRGLALIVGRDYRSAVQKSRRCMVTRGARTKDRTRQNKVPIH